MKFLKIIFGLFLAFTVFSCASTEKTITEIDEVEIIEEIEVIEVPPEPTPEELFIESLNNINLEFLQFPKTANFGKAFSSSFTVKVSDSLGNVLADYPVTFFYPQSKSNNIIEYAKTVVFTNEEGIAEYTQEPLNFSVKDNVIAYPAPAYENTDVLEACLNKSVQAPIKVRSNIISKGALLFIWDFNEKDRPINNSYEILSELRSYGITMVGNAPVNESSELNSPILELYKKNYEIVEAAYGYLICGSVKFIEPVTEVDGEYQCSLIADIKSVNMKTGELILEKTYSHVTTGSNWNKATSKCKEELSEIICEDLIYSL